MKLGESIWNRDSAEPDAQLLSDRGYIGAVSAFTVYGVVAATGVALLTMNTNLGLGPFLALGLIMPLAGIVLATFSNNWLMSLLGHTMVVVGLGAITGPVVALYKVPVVAEALVATCGVTLVTSAIGIAKPNLLRHWGTYLFVGLLALLGVRLAQIFLGGMIGMAINHGPLSVLIECGSAVLFSLYIVYDWGRALSLPRTLDNAVDVSMAIFLDIANLFLTLLRLFGGNSSSSSKD